MGLTVGMQLGRYEIRAPLACGGMGEVYRAFDRRLEREVAVKVLPDHLQRDQAVLARFDREAKALAAVSHPEILTVFDVGIEAGIAFVVTELLEGESLQSRIGRSPLPWKEALEIALSIVKGLDAAHTRGVIHGDLKPENVFLTGSGAVKIVDFGLARIEPETSSESSAEAPTVMISPAFAGTAQYMSPEQARGTPGDAQSDLFAFGSTLYAMLTRAPPFSGASFAELAAAVLRDAVPELGAERGIPRSLEQLIHSCLQKDREERVASAREVQSALESIAADPTGGQVTAPASAIDSLAILPFAHMETDPEMERLCDGLIGRIIDTLSHLPRLRVMALTTVFRYKGRLVDPVQVGRELNVRAVLTARIATPGDTPTIDVELVDARDGARLWGERFECDVCNLLELQETLAAQISERLEVRLLQTDRNRLHHRPTENTEAFRLYLRGRYYWNKRNREGLLRSLEEFELSLQQDPGFPLAYAGLADAYALLGGFGYLPPREAYTKAKSEAYRALELDSTLAEAHSSLATVMYRFDWDWKGAEREFRLTLQYNPGYATAHHWFGVYLILMGRFEEGLAENERALELDPLSLVVNWSRGYLLYYARRFADAIEQLTSTLAIDPTFAPGYVDTGLCWIQLAEFRRGIEEIRKGIDLHEPNSASLASLGWAYGRAGDRREARKILEELHALSKRHFVSWFSIAIVHIGLEDPDEAFRQLEKSLEKREDALVSLLVNPRLDPLRSDARFAELLHRVGLPPSS